MYVTRPLSLLRKSPESLSLATPEGPNSGYLVLCDEESETTHCFGLFKSKSIRQLPFPQDKDLSVWYTISTGTSSVVYLDEVLFVPVLDQPLSSNRYYVVRRDGKLEGQACANSKDEDKRTCCCFKVIGDVKARPLDPSDTYQQFEIVHSKYNSGFNAKSVAQDGYPPEFLRRKHWGLRMHSPRRYQLSEAQGVDSALRAQLPGLNFPLSRASSEPAVVGKWYCPFMFVKEEMSLKDQMRRSTFYEMTLEQRWDKIFECDNFDNDKKGVSVDVVVDGEEAFVGGERALWDKRNVEDGVIWFKSCENRGMGKEVRAGLSVKIMERLKWEQERVGWADSNGKQVRVARREEFSGEGGWRKFGCYVLIESFVLKRIDESVVLAYDFRHIHQIRSKWE